MGIIDCGKDMILILDEHFTYNATSNCSSLTAINILDNLCSLQKSCSIKVSNATFWSDDCFRVGSGNSITIAYECMKRIPVTNEYIGCFTPDIAVDQNPQVNCHFKPSSTCMNFQYRKLHRIKFPITFWVITKKN